MSERIKYQTINWIDGMKISKEHFLGEERALLDRLKDEASARLSDYCFGLIPSDERGRDAYSLEINSDVIRINYCRGITRGGVRIEILDSDLDELHVNTHQLLSNKDLPSSGEWFVTIRANPFERVPSGEPDPAETPLRHPFTRNKYSLEILSASQFNSSDFSTYSIPIAKIKSDSGGLQAVSNYIPPACSIQSCRDLLTVHQDYDRQLKEIESYAFEIITKVNHKIRRNESNTLSGDIGRIVQRLVEYISEKYDGYRLRYKALPPIYTVEMMVGLARMMRTSMRTILDKDGLLAYFGMYMDKSKSAGLDDLLDEACNLQYDHLDIRKSFNIIDRFLEQLRELLARLVELDYQQLARQDIVQRSTIYRAGDQKAPPPPRPTTKGGSPDIKIKNPNKGKGWDLK
jgi:hypothetical protein